MAANNRKRNHYDVLVLDAHTRQALVTVRSLGRKGLRVAALANSNTPAPAFSSRWCMFRIISPAQEGSDDYLRFLRTLLNTYQFSVIIPSADGTIAALMRERKRISSLTSIALGSSSALAIAVNKNKTLRIAKRLGIKTPDGVTITQRNQLNTLLPHVVYPIVLKPNISWVENEFGTKRVSPVLAANEKELLAGYEQLTEFGGEVILQSFLPGAQEAVSLLYAKKKIYARFAQWASRTQPPMGGTSVLRQSIVVPDDTGKLSEKLIRAIDLEGYSEIEFKRDANGVPYLMEINPRLSMSVDIAVQSGIDFPYMLYQWAAGKLISAEFVYKRGIWERYLAGDIVSLTELLQQAGKTSLKTRAQSIGAFVASFFHPMRYDYIDWTDMKPVIAATIDFFLRNVKKLGKIRNPKHAIQNNSK